MATKRKAGRPKVYRDRVTTAVRLDKDIYKRLKIEAVKRELALNVIVAGALEQWLAKNEGKVRL